MHRHALSLTVLCLALNVSAFAGSTIFGEGPIDGFDNALFITGPNNSNVLGVVPRHFERIRCDELRNSNYPRVWFVAVGRGLSGDYQL